MTIPTSVGRVRPWAEPEVTQWARHQERAQDERQAARRAIEEGE